MKFCDYTNFDALFPSVVIDFPFHHHFQIITLRLLNLSIRLRAQDFYEVIVDEGKTRFKYHLRN